MKTKPFSLTHRMSCGNVAAEVRRRILERGIYSASASNGSSARRTFQAIRRGASRSGINSALRFGCVSAALRLCAFAFLLLPTVLGAATNDLSGALQKGLFEEEANRNLDAAIQAYQSVAARFDKDRQLAATAIFRLGECYRKLGKTNEAILQFNRIVHEFTDQATLVTLSRQNLAGLGGVTRASAISPGGANSSASDAAYEAESLRAQIEELKKLTPEKRRIVVQQTFPNPYLTSLMQDLSRAEQNVAGLSKDFGQNHPEVQKAVAVLDVINKQIDAQLEGVLLGLETKMNSALQATQTSQVSQKNTGSGGVGNEAVFADEEEQELRRVKEMLQNSPDLIDAPAGEARSLLGKAASKGELKVAKFLIEKGAAVNGLKLPNITPLHYAVGNGRKAVVDLLLDKGAKVDARTDSGVTPLHLAALKGYQLVAKRLLEAGAPVNARLTSDVGWQDTYIQYAYTSVQTPLDVAVAGGFTPIVELLLSKGAEANARSNNGQAPLHRAVAIGQAALVELLLSKGADANAKDSNGATPLVYAVTGSHLDVARLLLANKAKVNFASTAEIRNPNGGWSIYSGHYPLHFAIRTGDMEMLELLLKNAANPDVKSSAGNENGFTPLRMAVNAKRTDMVELLLNSKADPNLKADDGNAPLHVAVQSGNTELVQLLLDHGAEVTVKDQYGNISLHWAASGGSKAMIEMLLAKKPEINLQNNFGETALHFAARSGHKEIVELLLAKGAEVNIRNKNGQTPLDIVKSPKSPGFAPPPGVYATPATPATRIVPGTIPVKNDASQPGELAELLRHHGALDDLPDFNRIEVSRASSGYHATVFMGNTNGWSQYTLAELLVQQFGLLSTQMRDVWPASRTSRVDFWSGNYLRFPDLSRITIHRPEKDGKNRIAILVNFVELVGTNHKAGDVPLHFGDVVEVPEEDHPVSETWLGFVGPDLQVLTNLVSRRVTLVVGGKSTELSLAPRFSAETAIPNAYSRQVASFMLRSVLDQSKLVRYSSDLTRVKVIRKDSPNGKPREWLVDCSDGKPLPDLWLRDGDVIEVPDKR